jgi:hypothetical protein
VTGPDAIRDEVLRAARAAVAEGRGDATTWRIDVTLPADAGDLRDALRRARSAVARELPGLRWKLRGLAAAAVTAPSVTVHPLGAGVRLQARDRDILAFIALARALTTAQIAELLFPGKHRSVAHRRLRALGVGKGRLVRDAYYVNSNTSRVQVWGLTAPGYDLAEHVLGKTPPPRAELVRPQFLEHLVWLNELFVALAIARGAPARPAELGFRWICDHDRPIQVPERGLDGTRRDAVIAPDAILELPHARLRVFIEAERGTHTIVPVSITKTGATVAKVKRYATFFTCRAPGAVTTPTTVYQHCFGEGYAPTLLIVVHSQDRRQRVRAAVEPIVRADVERKLYSVEVLTMAEAKARYVTFVRSDAPPAPVPPERRTLGPGLDAGILRAGFDALVRTAKAAQRAGIPMAAEEFERVRKLRELLASLEASSVRSGDY